DVWEKDIIPAPRSSSTYETNPTWKASSYLRDINERVRALQSVVNRLEGRAAASVDPQAVASEVLRVLTPQAIAAAIPAELAAEVLDGMKRRLRWGSTALGVRMSRGSRHGRVGMTTAEGRCV